MSYKSRLCKDAHSLRQAVSLGGFVGRKANGVDPLCGMTEKAKWLSSEQQLHQIRFAPRLSVSFGLDRCHGACKRRRLLQGFYLLFIVCYGPQAPVSVRVCFVFFLKRTWLLSGPPCAIWQFVCKPPQKHDSLKSETGFQWWRMEFFFRLVKCQVKSSWIIHWITL